MGHAGLGADGPWGPGARIVRFIVRHDGVTNPDAAPRTRRRSAEAPGSSWGVRKPPAISTPAPLCVATASPSTATSHASSPPPIAGGARRHHARPPSRRPSRRHFWLQPHGTVDRCGEEFTRARMLTVASADDEHFVTQTIPPPTAPEAFRTGGGRIPPRRSRAEGEHYRSARPTRPRGRTRREVNIDAVRHT